MTVYSLCDDCDTLLVKLQNKIDDYYYEGIKVDIDKLEEVADKLENAIDSNNKKLMRSILNSYSTMFKRYQ